MNITVPLLTPSIFFLTIMQAIGGFQVRPSPRFARLLRTTPKK